MRREFATTCLPPPMTFNGNGGSRSPKSGWPVRIGYVSAFFDRRNWMKPVWGLINRHDRERFEINLISDTPESSLDRGYKPDPSDTFHDISALPSDKAARRISELDLDILVDLNAYSRPARLPIYAFKPVPIQLAWFNMFATSGMSTFDALIGDSHVIPPEEESFYTERIERVPGSYSRSRWPIQCPKSRLPRACVAST